MLLHKHVLNKSVQELLKLQHFFLGEVFATRSTFQASVPRDKWDILR